MDEILHEPTLDRERPVLLQRTASKDGSPVSFAVVGGGASGCLVAAQLLRQADDPVRVLLFTGGGEVGRGVAYSTQVRSHLLNVRAGRMSAFDDDAEHFVRWLGRRSDGCDVGPDAFVPRALYGEYLRQTLDESAANARPGVELRTIADEVLRLEPATSGITVHLRRTPSVTTAAAVLALGNPPPADLPGAEPGFLTSERYRRDPWSPGALAGFPQEGAVLLVGTGLTMIDVALALEDQGHRGPIWAVSRRGLVPRAHSQADPGGAAGPELPRDAWPRTIRAWVRAVRARASIDRLRSITEQIWRDLPEREKRRFLRHVQPYWDVWRHRTAPEIARRLAALRGSGRLTVAAGRIASLHASETEAWVRWTPRGHREPRELRDLAAVVNCTGPSFAQATAKLPLVRDLLARGLVRLDPLRLGLDATPRGEALSATGEPSPRLSILGPPLRGVLWETTAIPEIRGQAKTVATRLLAATRSCRTRV